MASLPASNTARVWFDYATGGAQSTAHTVQFRYVGTDRSASAQQEAFYALISAWGADGFPPGWKVLGVRTALAGEDFSLPQVPYSGFASFVGYYGGPRYVIQETYEITYQGRSASGPRRADFSLFGMPVDFFSPNGRFPVGGSGTPAAVNRLYNALVAAGSVFRAIDGSTLLWYPYANTGQNAYWKRRLRIS